MSWRYNAVRLHLNVAHHMTCRITEEHRTQYTIMHHDAQPHITIEIMTMPYNTLHSTMCHRSGNVYRMTLNKLQHHVWVMTLRYIT